MNLTLFIFDDILKNEYDIMFVMNSDLLYVIYMLRKQVVTVNMASVDIERKVWKTIVLMIVKMIQEWKRWIQMSQLYDLYSN